MEDITVDKRLMSARALLADAVLRLIKVRKLLGNNPAASDLSGIQERMRDASGEINGAQQIIGLPLRLIKGET